MLAWVRVPPNATPFLVFFCWLPVVPADSAHSTLPLCRGGSGEEMDGVHGVHRARRGNVYHDQTKHLIAPHRLMSIQISSSHDSFEKGFHVTKPTKKGYGGTGIRARVKRITTAYANHYTIPPRLTCEWLTCDNGGGFQIGPQV